MQYCPQDAPAVQGVKGKQVVGKQAQVDQRRHGHLSHEQQKEQEIHSRSSRGCQDLPAGGERSCPDHCAGQRKADPVDLGLCQPQEQKVRPFVQGDAQEKGRKGPARVKIKIRAEEGNETGRDLNPLKNFASSHKIPP